MRRREYTPFTQAQREQLIATSLVRPGRNLVGDLGPRCPTCSGLGAFLRLGGGDQGVTRAMTKCHCEGSGIDLDRLDRLDRQQLWTRIQRLESAYKLKITSTATAPTLKMSKQYWMEAIFWATASGTAVANTVTETILFPNVTIPANYMQDGRALRLSGFGGHGTTATPTIIFSARWGGVSGTVISKSFTATTTSGVGGGASMTAMWAFEIMIQTRSNGSAGTLMTNGAVTLSTSTAPTAGTVTNYGMPIALASGSTGGTTPVAVTADLTADTALSFTVTWGTANAANSIQGHQYVVESMN